MSLATAAAGVAVAAGLGVSGAVSFSSSGEWPVTHRTAPSALPTVRSHGGTPVRLAAFTIVSNANGTTKVTVNLSRLGAPGALQQALAQHGISAVVRQGSFCYTAHKPPSQEALTDGQDAQVAQAVSNEVKSVVLVIKPAKMPAGTKLSFGYSRYQGGRSIVAAVMYANSYKCTSNFNNIQVPYALVWTH